jgi:hypothetical protein
VHFRVARAVELVQRQLDQQLDSLDRLRLGQAAKRPQKPRVGLLVASELTLHRGVCRRNRRRERAQLGRDDRDRFAERFVRLAEMPCRRQRPGSSEQQLDPLFHGCRLRKHSQCRAEPACSALRSEPSGGLAGRAQHSHRGEVALAR